MTAPQTTTQRVAETMRNLIFTGELAAGSDHLETELAERFGMSRTPVREAALLLQAQGLVSVRPRRGVRILPITPDDVAEVYDVLSELESHAAGRAAAAGHSDATLAGMTAAIAAMDDALAGDDRDAWATADDRFHRELVRLGNNGRIRAIAGMMHDQVRRARTLTLGLLALPPTSNDHHRAVLDAIRSRAPYKAQSIQRAYRERCKELLVALLREHRIGRL